MWRRMPLYAGASALLIGVQALVVLVWHVPHGLIYSSLLLPPLLTTLVYAFVWADTEEERPAAASTWERVLERSWAVIIIDLGVGYVQGSGVNGIASSDPFEIVSGIAILVLTAPLVFVDVSATVDEMPVWWILPGAFWRGVRAIRSGSTYLRAVAIVAIGILTFLVQAPLMNWMQAAHLANAEFWAQVPIGTLTVPPIAALTALVYRDAKRTAASDPSEAA
jgi:hypothetical protein